MRGIRSHQGEETTLLTVTLTERQYNYLKAMFRERLESHEIREMTGYPRDERGARLAMELWEALFKASREESRIQQNDDESAMGRIPTSENGQPPTRSGPQGLQSQDLMDAMGESL